VITEPVTFVCWLWQGWRAGQYDYRHVNRLYRQLQQHMTGAWRLVCITDQPAGIECETFPLWSMPRAQIPNRRTGGFAFNDQTPDCFVRLKLFDPNVGRWFGNLLVSIDLDTTVYSDLRPLLTADPFKIAINEVPRANRYCGTLWQLRPGAHPEVWSDYDSVETPRAIAAAKLRGSDQSWLTLKLPGAPTWTRRDGVYWLKGFDRNAAVPTDARLVYFAGDVNPWSRDCALMWPKFYTPLE
jgi:hypothetical protein